MAEKKSFWRRTRGKITLGIMLAIALFVTWALVHVSSEQMVYDNFQSGKRHHGKGHFHNLHATRGAPGVSRISKMYRIALGLTGQDTHPAPSVSANYKAKGLFRKNDSVTWLGHAGFQIRLKEANILADPVLSKRASPFSFAGPKRFQPPGLTLKQIGKVDVVFISHNHYDHFDADTLGKLPNREQIDMVVPLGFKKRLQALGYRKIHELDWWQSRKVRGLTFTCYPVQHFSGRGLSDRSKSLWASWGIEGKGLRLYFAGDTGYSPDFKRIGLKGGPFDLAFVPIGAYEPRELFRPIHMNPEEAVKASTELRAKAMVGMHWGTFPLSMEPPKDPPIRFSRAAQKAGYHKDNTWVMKVGETRMLTRRQESKLAPSVRPSAATQPVPVRKP